MFTLGTIIALSSVTFVRQLKKNTYEIPSLNSLSMWRFKNYTICSQSL